MAARATSEAMHAQVGQSRPTCMALPPFSHAYGAPLIRDGCSVGQILGTCDCAVVQ
jgi:hypothetical protein